MKIHIIKPHESNSLFFHCISLRKKVFIEEQQVAYEIEQDGLDNRCYHLLVEDNISFIATMRMQEEDDKVKFGRIAVVKERRSMGIGTYIVTKALTLFPNSTIYLHAQENAVPFYLSLGFTPTDERTIEAGISHITMLYST
jgi:predicted GNAT family N-acyltransferase